MSTLPLLPGIVYLAHDRFVCAEVACAGTTALATGRTLGGAPVLPVSRAEVEEWATYGLGPLTCECGKVVAL